jgi:hypothetical protein
MTTTTHGPVDVEVLTLSECIAEDCEHEDGCPTSVLTVCHTCNAEAQSGRPIDEWEGAIARCPIFDTGVPREQAQALMSALTVPKSAEQESW